MLDSSPFSRPESSTNFAVGDYMRNQEYQNNDKKRDLFRFRVSDVQDYDMEDMSTSSVLLASKNKAFLESNSPSKKRIKQEALHSDSSNVKYYNNNNRSMNNNTNDQKSVSFRLSVQEVSSDKPQLVPNAFNLEAISSRMPFIKDIMIGEKMLSKNFVQESKTVYRMENVTSQNIQHSENSGRIAPNDAEEIAALKTGEHAIAFFSKAGKNSAVKFVYLNRVKTSEKEFQPYSLVVVPREEVDVEYFTMSASGVVHFQEGQPTEYVSLSDWMRESLMFSLLQKIKFFKFYLMNKCFRLWFTNARYSRFCKTKKKVANRLFISKKSFQPTLLKIHKLCYNMQEELLMDFGQESGKNSKQATITLKMEKFLVMQQKQRQRASKHFDSTVESVEELLKQLCDSVVQSSQVPSVNSDNIESFLKTSSIVNISGDEGKKSKSMVDMKKEEQQRKLALKKAKEEVEMLSDFIRLADYMVVEFLVQLVKKTMIDFKSVLQDLRLLMFEVTIFFKGENTTVFQPTEQSILDILRRNYDDMVHTTNSIIRLLYLKGFKLYFTQPNKNSIVFEEEPASTIGKPWQIATILVSDEVLSKNKIEIERNLHSDWSRVLSYGSNVEKLKKWYTFGNSWSPEIYANKPHSVQEFSADITKVNDAIKELERFEVTANLGMLFAESRNLQQSLKPIMDNIKENIKVEIANVLKTNCTKLQADLKIRIKVLQERPVKLDLFIAFVENLNTQKTAQRELMQNVEEVDNMFDLAKMNRALDKLKSSDIVEIEELSTIKKQFLDAIQFSEEYKENTILERSTELDRFIQDVNNQLMKIINQLSTGEYITRQSDPATVLEKLEFVEKDIKNCEEKSKMYTEYQKLLNIPPKTWTNLTDVKSKFALRFDIWKSLDDFIKKTESWDTTEVANLNCEQLEKDVQSTYVKAYNIVRSTNDDVADLLKSKAAVWKERLNCIMMIGNKDMKSWHWDAVFKGMKKDIPRGNYNFTLRQLTSLGIFHFKDVLQEVSAMASGEADLQKMLDKIDSVWKEVEFSTKTYRDNKLILGSVEEIIQLLEDNQVTLQTMQGSPYIAGLKAQADKWESRLALISELIEEWLTCQKNWMYLEFIFGSDDIKRQLPEEAVKFAKVDQDFKDLMTRTDTTKKALQLCDESLLEMLKSCNEMLEQVQKKMEDFLETKREAFPRFFFLSNDELLEILSQTREPRAVQDHLSKCFDNIKSLQFKDTKSPEILAMISSEGENVPFSQSVFATGNVEYWLQNIENMMRKTLHDIMRETLLAYHKAKSNDIIAWYFGFPSQCIMCVDQIVWTDDVSKALNDIEFGGQKSALKNYLENYIKSIDKLVAIVRRTDLTSNQRRTINSLLVLDVHARDVVDSMIKKECSSVNDFNWTMQLRYYWERDVNDCVVKQANASFRYGYEYLGNQPRLVITPLTDRCFMTCTGALNLYLGASPQGPAGTGKTESVKDLAKALARQCVVFNCSEGLGVKMMGRMFAGLAQAGAWACFDEFNRIDIEVLSVIAQYMRIIQKAIILRQKHFLFDDREISLNFNYGVFITMNPGYAGRTELPDNLKALFRPVAMMIPDYALIAEIMLFSEGFTTARVLAKKMVQLFKLSSEQLSKQDHYDFGMRAVKSILVRAGTLKRGEPNVAEDIVLIRSMRDSNVPKFLQQDVVLFMAIIQDLFPGIVLPELDYGYLQEAIELHLVKKNRQIIPDFVRKIIQLQETMVIRHGVMLVGTTGTGKTVAYETLQQALTYLNQEKGLKDKYKPIETHIINPKSVTMNELYGEFDELTHDWHDGSISKTARSAVKDLEYLHWIVLDGPVDALWIENMNTVLDDNKMLCLTNGERIKLPSSIMFVFEVQDLAVASPATVSRCGMVYMEENNLDGVWGAIFKSWKKEAEKKLPQDKVARIASAIDILIEPSIKFIRSNCSEFIKSVNSNLIHSMLGLLDILLTPKHGVNPKSEYFNPNGDNQNNSDDAEKGFKVNIDRMIDLYCIYAFIWSFGANLDDKSRDLFSNFAKDLIKQIDKTFPIQGQIYDFYVNIEKQAFDPWEDKVSTFQFSAGTPFFNMLVPTIDTTRTAHLVTLLSGASKNVLITGVSGVGKTVLISDILRNELNAEDPEGSYVAFSINLSAQTTSKNIQDIMEQKLESKRKNLLGAPSGKKAIAFIDDLNMPKLEKYGAQPPIELLRQMIDQGGFYDRQKVFFKHVSDVSLLTACAPPGGGRNEVTPRLIRHFHMINFPSLSAKSMRTIFYSILNGFLSTFSDEVQSIVDNVTNASINMYDRIKTELLPRPSTSHYTFNLRDLSKLFQGILQITSAKMKTKQNFLKLWVHESCRVFQDRLINVEDKNYFLNLLVEMISVHFKESWDLSQFDNIYFGDYAGKADRVYEEVADVDKIPEIMRNYLADYNVEKNSEINLVFFKDAVNHISRICRIIRQPRGNALLVGIGGSGRHCLTRLAAFIAGCKCLEIEVTKNFKHQQFRDAIKTMILTAGCENQPVVFLFSDTQIVEEGILEDIHNLLNTGEIANLFEQEDIERIISSTRPRVKALGKLDTRDVVYRYFVHLVRENFHTVLCMNPIGSSFRNRIRMFPSLVNNCTIDWFTSWPKDALFSVAKSFLSQGVEALQESDTLLDAVCNMCVHIHLSVGEFSELFLKQLRRYNYTTPTSYLELINLYMSMMKDQQSLLGKMTDKYNGGLSKLDDTNKTVKNLKIELTEKQPILDQAVKDTQQLSEQLTVDKAKADEVKAVCQKEEADCLEIMKKTQAFKDECSAVLNEAMPDYLKALEAVKTLKKEQISEVKVLRNPPELVKKVMEAVCILFNFPPTWEDALKLLSDSSLLQKLEKYDINKVDDIYLKKLKKYVEMPDFQPAIVRSKSAASESLCMWIIAINTYGKVSKKIVPMKQSLEAAEKQLEAAKKQLEEKQASLAEIVARVENLERKKAEAEQRMTSLNDEIEKTKQRLIRAEKLVNGLSGERVRWEDISRKLKIDTKNLIGDILLAAGSVSYLGPFTSSFRMQLLDSWIAFCKDLLIPVGDSFNLTSITEQVRIKEWISNGLPADNFSVENAILVEKGRRWPLFIDPQNQANKWIRNTEKGNGLKTIKANDTELLRKLEAAIRVGLPALIENIGEELDPALEPILLKQTFRQGGRLLIRLGDQDVDYNPKFKLYLTTKLPNPHYMPEVCIRVTIINFTVTLKGLEDQLLADVVGFERPDLEKLKDDLVTKIAAGKTQLKEIEDKILDLLYKASSETILDDEVLIAALDESKVTSEKIKESVEQAETTAVEIDNTRESYRSAATRASILYFVIADMTTVDPMYQNSLAFFKNLFAQCLQRSEKADTIEKRLLNLISYTTETTYNIICRGLFERDKLLFSFIISVQILKHQGAIEDLEWNFFLRGGSGMLSSDEITTCDFDWISKNVWLDILALSKLKGFQSLIASITEQPQTWKSLCENDEIHNMKLPEPFEVSLSQWQKLLLLKALRAEKIVFGVTKLVSTYLGPKFVESPPLDLKAAFGDSNNKTPIVFVLSSGADPQSLFDKFAQDKGYFEKVLSLSLGQGQGKKAAQLISNSSENGNWVFLQNCHLAVSWMSDLERIVEELGDRKDMHPDFRLWLTSMPSPKFPPPVLQSSIKLTYEPPKGLKANMKSVLKDAEEMYEGCSKPKEWKKLFYGLIFFHALVQERRKFGSVGWNIPYEWNTSDLDASFKSIRLYLEEQDFIPWEALRYTIGVIHYGGRVTDFLDLRCLRKILKKFFKPAVLEESHKLTTSKLYVMPPEDCRMEQLKMLVSKLPPFEEPEVFGLHANANITFQQKETKQLLDTIISMQPRTSGGAGGGKSNDEIVLDIAVDFQKRLPKTLNLEEASSATFAKTEDGTVNSLGIFFGQEVDQFNALLVVMEKTLIELQRAIKGFVVMSAELELMYNCFLYQKVPEIWESVGYPSLKPLSPWFDNLILRVEFLRDWLVNGPPSCYWISSFFFPQGFLTGVLQMHARKYRIPIDILRFKTHVLTDEKIREIAVEGGPKVGVYIRGLFMEGGRWSKVKQAIEESGKGELYSGMPYIWLEPYVFSNEKSPIKLYKCPVYKTATRAGTLSTTGLSTNFVLTVELPPGENIHPDHWVERATCLLLEIANE